MIDTTSQAFFEELYTRDPDPWSFGSSKYELDRYKAIIAALAGCRFKRVLEPGCSIGVLTEQLANLADRVDASDISPTAVRRSQQRCRHLPNVYISVSPLSSLMGASDFDLLVLSEICYYFSEEDLIRTAQRLVQGLSLNGLLLAAHWLGYSTDHVLSGQRVHEILCTLSGLVHDHGERHDGFRLDRWRRV